MCEEHPRLTKAQRKARKEKARKGKRTYWGDPDRPPSPPMATIVIPPEWTEDGDPTT